MKYGILVGVFMFRLSKRLIAALICVILFTSLLSSCRKEGLYTGVPDQNTEEASPPAPSENPPNDSNSPSQSPADGTSPSEEALPSADPSSASSEPETELVAYNGVVEHLFFHPLVTYPELAFDGDNKAKGIDEYMVTVSEYDKILQSLYEKDYILINMNDVWSEYTDENGVQKMKKNTLMLPEGKKPLILSYDDVNYYNYMIANGFTYKLVIGEDGELWSFGLDPAGKPVYSQDLDAITILNKFVEKHPDFSFNGTMGCLNLTGYEGILGYRTMTDIKNQTPEAEAWRQCEITAVKPIIKKLKEDGWYFASHTWGHISLTNATLESATLDMERWLTEVGSLVGPTKLMIYPFGARPDGGNDVTQTGDIFQYYQSKGFRIFASVGVESYYKIKPDICAVICDRMHADGYTLRHFREQYLKFYDAKDVFDYEVRPAEYGRDW
jgi:hypothetical protein